EPAVLLQQPLPLISSHINPRLTAKHSRFTFHTEKLDGLTISAPLRGRLPVARAWPRGRGGRRPRCRRSAACSLSAARPFPRPPPGKAHPETHLYRSAAPWSGVGGC